MTTKANELVIGIGEFAVAPSGDSIVTFSLGSCIGLTLWSPELRVGGMVHSLLPLSKADRDRAQREPAVFVDTGVSGLLQQMFDKGASAESLVVCVAGGGNIMDSGNKFRIGERNHAVAKKVLWKNNLLIAHEDCGGNTPRTMRLCTQAGVTTIHTGREVYTWEPKL